MLSDKSGLSFGRCYKEENSELPVSCYSVTDSAVSLPLSVSQSLTISRVQYVGIGTRAVAHKGHGGGGEPRDVVSQRRLSWRSSSYYVWSHKQELT